MSGNYFYISSQSATMHEETSRFSQSVSDAYFTEEVIFIKNNDKKSLREWVQIQTKVDGYIGWIEKSSLHKRTTPFPSLPTIAKVTSVTAPLYKKPTDFHGSWKIIPFESKLEVLDTKPIKTNAHEAWYKVGLPTNEIGYISTEDVSIENKLLSLTEVSDLAKQFLNIPYIWGGRSSFGYDCSGFSQMLYRQTGHHIPRDANDQMHWKGFKEVSKIESQAGDLIFFGKVAGKAIHVGLCLGDDAYIHSSVSPPGRKVKISTLTDDEKARFAFITYRSLIEKTLLS